jgi:hypothetical protein
MGGDMTSNSFRGRIIASSFLSLPLLASLSSIAPSEERSALRGVGTGSCAEFGKAYQGNPKLAEVVYGSWTQGFLSGLNLQRAIDHKPMRDLPSPEGGQNRSIRSLCDRRPLATFFEVAIEYFDSLQEMPVKNPN